MVDVIPDGASEVTLASEDAWVLVVAEELTRQALVRLLEEGGYPAVPLAPDQDIAAFLAEHPPGPDLLLISLDCSRREALAPIRSVRSSARGRQVPILGVTAFERIGFDLQMLRSHGVIGLVDEQAAPAVVLERVERVLRPGRAGRRAERARCLFPVWVRGDRGTTEEFALDLSATGARMTASEAASHNSEIELRFRLPMVANDTVVATARVVHQSKHRNSWARFEVGVFFYPMSDRHSDIMEREIERLLVLC